MDGLLNRKFSAFSSQLTQPTFGDQRTDKAVEASGARERFENARLLVEEFVANAERFRAPFSIMTYGSLSYGFKGGSNSTFTDIDLILIVPRGISIKTFIKKAKDVFRPDSEFDLSAAHLQGLLNGDWEVARMYGDTRGSHLSFRIMCDDTFRSLPESDNLTRPLREVARPGQKMLIKNEEWSFRERRFISVEYVHTIVSDAEGKELVMVERRVFSEEYATLGIEGVKLLQAIPVYGASDQGYIAENLMHIWRVFVRISLKEHPDLSDNEIIDSIIPAERFSPEYRDQLRALIQAIRAEISEKR